MEWIVLILIAIIIAAFVQFSVDRKKKEAERSNAIAYSSAIDRERKLLLKADDRASLPILDASAHGYRPVSRENLIAVQDNVSKMEYKSSGQYSTRGESISIPIVKGVRYRIGGGSIRAEKSWQITATGRLLITDKAIIFESPEKNERITWGQIANVELMTDGFQIAKRSGPPRLFVAGSPDPRFSAVLELMLARTN